MRNVLAALVYVFFAVVSAPAFSADVWYEGDLLRIADDFNRAAGNDLGSPWYEYEHADNVVRLGTSQTAAMLPSYSIQSEAGFSAEGYTITDGTIFAVNRCMSIERSGWFGVSYRASTLEGGANIAAGGYNVRVRTYNWQGEEVVQLRYGSEVLVSVGIEEYDTRDPDWTVGIEATFEGDEHSVVILRNPGTEWEKVLAEFSYSETALGRAGAGYFGAGTSWGYNHFTEFNVYERPAPPPPPTCVLAIDDFNRPGQESNVYDLGNLPAGGYTWYRNPGDPNQLRIYNGRLLLSYATPDGDRGVAIEDLLVDDGIIEIELISLGTKTGMQASFTISYRTQDLDSAAQLNAGSGYTVRIRGGWALGPEFYDVALLYDGQDAVESGDGVLASMSINDWQNWDQNLGPMIIRIEFKGNHHKITLSWDGAEGEDAKVLEYTDLAPGRTGPGYIGLGTFWQEMVRINEITVKRWPSPADLNGDCIVDLADFAMMAQEWLECTLMPDCID